MTDVTVAVDCGHIIGLSLYLAKDAGNVYIEMNAQNGYT